MSRKRLIEGVTLFNRRLCRHIFHPPFIWNKDNSDYFKSNYLQKKLEAVTGSEKASKPLPAKSRLKSGLPLEYVQEVIGIQQLVIIEYFGQLLFRRFQEVLKGQVIVKTEKVRRLPPTRFSRSDRR
jgi:hypothetical protein